MSGQLSKHDINNPCRNEFKNEKLKSIHKQLAHEVLSLLCFNKVKKKLTSI